MRVEYYSHFLTDNDVANIARQSFGSRAAGYTDEQNARLIRFLANGMTQADHNAVNDTVRGGFDTVEEADAFLKQYVRNVPTHWSPFAHPHITLRVSAPVPIRTQCFKTKVGMVENEESRRYISHTPDVYIPKEFRTAASDKKQGSGDAHVESNHFRDVYIATVNHAVNIYRHMIDSGVCPEQARFVLPQGCEVNWVWTGSLYAYANFYKQRSRSDAQYEVRLIAEAIDEIVRELYPVSWRALVC